MTFASVGLMTSVLTSLVDLVYLSPYSTCEQIPNIFTCDRPTCQVPSKYSGRLATPTSSLLAPHIPVSSPCDACLCERAFPGVYPRPGSREPKELRPKVLQCHDRSHESILRSVSVGVMRVSILTESPSSVRHSHDN
ncbi:hypothetical protein EDB84DRAFT_176498 [Lactarius hengduanensis]|nr:hypothetical protein EDB84DRAFT_176498 [Lactarius hengduanensis]